MDVAVIDSIKALFGAQALSPKATILKDWAEDSLTATAQDRMPSRPLAQDQAPWVSPPWAERLVMAGSETSPLEPGYLAGAVQAAHRAVAAVVGRMDGRTRA